MAKKDTPIFKPANQGDLIKADDWNTIQREGRYALRYHQHRRNPTVIDDAYDSGEEDNAKQIETLDLSDNAVTMAKIADGAVSEFKIADNAVTGLKIKDATVISAKIADKAITDTHISDAKISESKLKLNFPTHDNSKDLTPSQKSGLIEGKDTNLHIHDGRYYQKSEIDPVITRIRHATVDSWVEGGEISYTGPTNNVYQLQLTQMCCIINGSEVNFPATKQVTTILKDGKYAVLATSNGEIIFMDTSTLSLGRWLYEWMVYRKKIDPNIKYIPLYFFERKPGETVLTKTDLREGGVLGALAEAIEEIDRKFQDPIDTASIKDGTVTSAKLKIEDLKVKGNMVAQNLFLSQNNVNRGALFLATAGDFNHVLYNNYSNIDGEGQWDGAKWNVFAGLNIRIGYGTEKESALFINEKGNVGIGTTNPSGKLQIGDGQLVAKCGSQIDLIAPRGDTWPGITLAFSIGSDDKLEGWHWNAQVNGDFYFHSYSKGTWPTRVAFTESGNVGIGTATPMAKLDVKGGIYAGNSDIYFTSTEHNYTGLGNTTGYAAIENAKDHNTLMILGRTTSGGLGRSVSVWDTLIVNGNLRVTGNKSGYVVDQFINKVGQSLEQGDVIVIGKNQASGYYGLDNNIPIPEVDFTDKAYDSRVCGIVAEISFDIEKASEEEEKNTSKKKTKKEEVKEEIDKTKVGVNQKGMMVTLGAYAHCKVDADIASIEVGDLLTTSPTSGHAQKVLDKSMAIGAIIGKALAPLEKGKGKIPVLVMMQ